ncbi:MAG: alginate lyase, partial [Prevotella sp.]|nr:alginate lyase [Prevotella sp.]
PYPHDVMYWEEWPVAQPAILFAWRQFGDQRYWEAWAPFNHFPTHEEVIRNLPIRNPLIWLYK